ADPAPEGTSEMEPSIEDRGIADTPAEGDEMPADGTGVRSATEERSNTPGSWAVKAERASESLESVSQGEELWAPGASRVGDILLICTECGESFGTCLVVHQRAHLGLRPYTCSRCGAAFLQRGDLCTHLRVHTGERPFACPDCGRRFPSRRNLTCHQRQHPALGPHRCEQCGRSFLHKRNLVRHQRGHAGAQPYHCAECGDTTYTCPQCQQSFKYKGYLHMHQRKHVAPEGQALPGGGRPFTCAQCGKGFKNNGFLIIHQRAHAARARSASPTPWGTSPPFQASQQGRSASA
uniref:C2H2-type domain-containing protein n=1 Tax=Pelusios castaneus TaxID=367368 RepID=A0A8C8S7E1_9SAUR